MDVSPWLALAIGNSRLHWAWFDRTRLLHAWDMPHLDPEEIHRLVEHNLDFCHLPLESPLTVAQPELWFASAIPQQAELWQAYSRARMIALSEIPLHRLYPTLGIDRALAAWGAARLVGLPVLVIDGGTALTLTGISAASELVGGAILPGLRLQWRSLSQSTAALPEITAGDALPDRWATNTIDAIRSGVMHTVLSGLRDFIADWKQQFPHSAIVLTGGDGELLHRLLPPEVSAIYQPHLLLHSIAELRSLIQSASS